MTKRIRQQLTLFADKSDAAEIEAIRKMFNPQQSALINCHVTLCREDEIKNIDRVLENLHILDKKIISIQFDQAKRFDNGKGVLIPSSGDNDQFHKLRECILKGSDIHLRRHEPHITLMHPGNSACTNEIFDTIKKVNLPAQLNFKTISLIEQVDGGQWQTIQTFNLKPG